MVENNGSLEEDVTGEVGEEMEDVTSVPGEEDMPNITEE